MDYEIRNSNLNITPYGGLNFILDALERKGVDKIIDGSLGARNYRAKYSYSDLVKSLFSNCLTNGEFVSDLEHLKGQYRDQIYNNIPSPDTVEYACSELMVATQNITSEKDEKIIHQFNNHDKLNDLLVRLCVDLGQLVSGNQGYILDYDHVVLENDKQDALTSYKKTKAYQPGFAFINGLLVNYQNRNGNTPAKMNQFEALDKCFKDLSKYSVSVNHFRADAASYQKSVVELVESQEALFYIRIAKSDNFLVECGLINDWNTIDLNDELIEVASLKYKPFGEKKEYRVVVKRILREDRQSDIFSRSPYDYYGIMTNNTKMDDKEIIEFYNKRGNDSENANKNLLNDFNLHRLPFMDLDKNTVYMGIVGICNNLFEYVKRILVENKVKGIELKHRVKKVCYKYVSVCTQLIVKGSRKIIKVFSPKAYHMLVV